MKKKKLYKVVVNQLLHIKEQNETIEKLEGDLRKNKECTEQRKRDAGYHPDISFDIIWAKALTLLKEDNQPSNAIRI